MTISNNENEMNALLNKLEIDKTKELIKQQKEQTLQSQIESEIYKNKLSLNLQTEAIKNVIASIEICNLLETDNYDAAIRKTAFTLLKESIKRARNEYK